MTCAQSENMKKKCSGCDCIKSISDFYKNCKNKSGLQNYCKKCMSEKNKLCRKNKKQKFIITNKFCKNCNSQKDVSEFYKWKYSSDGLRNICKDCWLEQGKEYEKKEGSKLLRRVRWKKYYKKEDFRLRTNISRMIRKCVFKDENSSILNYLPYTMEELKQHLESQFEDWMNWNNYGKCSNVEQRTWWIDHIIPQSKLPYDSMRHSNFKKCWSLENLRPLEKIENIKKGNKIR